MSTKPTLSPTRNRSLLSVAKKQLIVTGGAGFIGSNLVATLNKRGIHDALIVDRLGSGTKWQNLQGLRFDDILSVDDFRDRVRQSGVPAGSTVFHLGAPGCERADAGELVDGIHRYSRELAEACIKNSARMIYASSAATYGSGDLGFFDNESTTSRLQPLSPYGFAKQLFDLWALQNGHFDKLVGLKLFNVYGSREQHKGDMKSLVSRLHDEIRETGRATLFKGPDDNCTDGEPARDLIHVDDVVSTLLHFFDFPNKTGLFNCGTGRARTPRDIASAIFSALEMESKIEYVDLPAERRGSFQKFTQADISSLQTAGVDTKFRTIEEGIGELVKTTPQTRAAA